MRKLVCILIVLCSCLCASADPGYNITASGALSFCQGGNITLTATGAPAGATFQWTKNNANIGGATSSTFTITNAATTASGAYSVIVDTGNGGGPIHYDTINIVVNPRPTASFTFSPNNICISTPVSFTNTSSGTGLTYSWTFGDPNSGTSNTSTLANPTHRFIGTPGTTPQTFRVKLTARSSAGCTHTDSLDVTVNQSPGTQLSGTGFTSPNTFRSCVTSTSSFTFLNQSSTMATNVSYRIIWGDATPDFTTTSATNWTTTHSFGVGSHPIYFIVEGAGGCIDTATYYVFVGTNPAVSMGNPGNTSICSGDSLTFPISNISNNAPGTVYNITFNDGYTVSYTHPFPPATPPSSVSHVFNTTSCGTNSSNGSTTFTNSYSATITASNPCGTSSGSVVPIYVSSKPDASLIITPNDTVCVNSAVTFTSTSPLNQSVDAGSGSCTPGRNVWSITPSTGFTITGGTLGNTFGFADPAVWSNGTPNINVNFTTTGTYTIRLITGNSSICQTDTAEQVICVNPQPTSTFTIDNNAGCTPVNVATTNNSNTPICGNNAYAWTVTYANAQACTPNSSNYTITSGSLTSQNPSFQFINPGVYTIRLVTSNSGGACVSPATTQQVTVKSKPNVSLAAVGPICQNQSVTPVATVNNCYSSVAATYSWAFQNGTPATSASLNPGAITYATTGTHNITLDVTNECGVTQVIRTVQVNPRPDITVPANQVFCAGVATGAFTFSSGLAGTTFSWTNSNTAIGLAASGSGNIASFTAANPGASAITSTITVTATNGSCTATATFTITVNPQPPLPGVTTPVNYCVGETASALSATAAGGHTLLWYTAASGGVGSTTAPTPNTAVAATTNYYVSQVNTTTNCESNRAQIVVNVRATPVIGSATGNNPVSCGGATGSIVLSGLTAGSTYTVTYIKNGGPATVLNNQTANGSGVITIGSLTAGIYSNITVTLNGCTSAAMGPITLSDPNPPNTPTASANAPICSGNTLTLSASTTTPGAASYTWSGPNGFSSTQQNPSITNATTAASGTYTVTVSISGCTSAAGTVDVVVNQTPAGVTAGSNSPLCTGSNLNLISSSSTNGVSYSWIGPNGFSSTQQNPVITNATTAATGTYTVTVTLGTCSATATAGIVVNPTPSVSGSSSTDPTTCNTATGTIHLTGLTANTSYSVSYVKNGGAATVVNITSSAAGEVVITGLTAGIYTNIFVSLGACNSAPVGPITLSDPNPPSLPNATSNSPVCSGNTLTLGATTTSPGTATYTWSGPNGFSSAVQNPNITNVTTAATGTYTVIVTIAGCSSGPGTVNVTVNPSPATPTAGSNTPVCSGGTLNLTASSATGGVSYSWTGPNAFTSAVQNPSINNVTTAAGGVYTVTATLGLCSAPNTTTVVINPTPVIGGTSFTNPVNCASLTGTITLTGLIANAVYTVSYVKNGGSATVMNNVTANAAGNIVINNLGAGVYTNIFVTRNGCPSTPVGPVTLADPNPPATPVAGSNSPVCTGATLNLTASTATPGAVTYNWTGPGGFTSNVQNPSILNAQPAQSGWYYVSVTLNSCTSLTDSVNVTVTALPAGPAVTSPVNYCIGATAVPLSATPTPGNSLRWYTVPTGGVFTTTPPTPSTAVAGTTSYYVSQATALGCEGARSQVQVIVNPDAIAQYNANPVRSCAPFNINASVIQPVIDPTRNGTYQWYANGTLIGTGTTFPGYAIAVPGDSVLIKLKVTSLFGCKNDSTQRWFYTVPRPVTGFNVSDTMGCGPLSVSFTNTTPPNSQFSYQWNFGNGVTSTVYNPGPVVFQPNPFGGDTVYRVRLSVVTQCDTIVMTRDIRVKSRPKATFTPGTTYGCSPLTVTFNNITLGATMAYQWDFGDGSPILVVNNTAPVQHTYHTAQQDTFYVKLIAMNNCGSDTGTYAIVVAASTINLNVTVNGNEKSGCAPHTVRFINNSIGATNFVWDLGDGNIRSTTKNIDTLVHTYTATGTFVATIRASNGCTDTTGSVTIQVFRKPIPDFAVNPVPSCVGDTLQFTNQTDTATSLLWNFGNGVTSQLNNPRYAYTTAGTYDVKLIAVRQYGPGNACTDSITKRLTVLTSLPGSFSLSDSVGNCIPFNVTFTNNSRPSTITTWNFGDGGVDTGDVVTHTYLQAGTYTVTMTARDPGGCRYIATRQIAVSGPAGSFFYDRGYICGNTPVRFEANVTGTDSLRWDFGDGTILTTTTSIVYHVYAQPGNYIPSVRLLAGTSGTCNRLLQGVDTVKIDYVKAGFRANPVKACGATTISFTDTSRSYFGLQSWQWNFGDGNNSTTRHPVHTYTSTNTWPVQLVVNSISGCSDTANVPLPVKVDNRPVATIVAPDTACAISPVTYTALVNSTDPVTYYGWTFSNGAAPTGAIVTNSFPAQGTYNARLIIGTGFGCYDTTNKSIVINPSPVVVTGSDMVICRGQSAVLNATGGLSYQWTPFTGLSCVTCPNPVATPLTTTQYVITGYNSYGCPGRDTILITVPQPIDVITAPAASVCIGSSVQLNATGAATYEWSPATALNCTTCAAPVANPTVTTVYRVIGRDAYNCFQDTAYVTVGVGGYPVVNVGTDKIVATGTQIQLAPTTTNGPIAQWSWIPPTDLSCAGCPSPVATAKRDICYTVTATNIFGCSGRDTMCIKVFCESSQVFIPNAFTPDGDGVNDLLVVKAKGVKLVKNFRIFNRWGQLVFEKTSFPPNTDSYGWDGKVNGTAAPPDVYVYTCEVVCEEDTHYTYKGNVAIIK